MGFGVSIFLIAVGAILAFAVEVATPGVDLDVIGVILMIVGAIGLLFSALYWGDVWPGRGRTVVREREYVDTPVVEDHHHTPATVRERRVVEHRDYP